VVRDGGGVCDDGVVVNLPHVRIALGVVDEDDLIGRSDGVNHIVVKLTAGAETHGAFCIMEDVPTNDVVWVESVVLSVVDLDGSGVVFGGAVGQRVVFHDAIVRSLFEFDPFANGIVNEIAANGDAERVVRLSAGGLADVESLPKA